MRTRITARLAIALASAALLACERKAPPPAPPAPQVAVIRLVATPTTFTEEYVGQTEAVDTVEIRARVGGLLDRQAFLDGADVKRDQLLFVIDPQPFIAALSQARATLAQATAAWKESRENLARARPLFEDGALSRQDLDTAIAKEASDAGSVKAAEAQVRQAELNLGYTSIRAPRAGVIGRAQIKRGGLVSASSTLLATLYSIDPMYIDFTVSEPTLVGLQQQFGFGSRESLREGPPSKIRLSDGSFYKYEGRLDYIDPAVDPRNGTLQVRLATPNPDRTLRAGQFVRVVLPVRRNADAIRIPQQAVTELQGEQSVLVVGPDDKLASRKIVATTRVGNQWVVEKGLSPGELVVVEGIAKLKPGAAVKPVLAGGEPAAPSNPPPVPAGR
ncbi:MAG TPA: efflux RND transporter periplasmic adaptor subunit [Rhodocyclaceae bacterium]